MEGRDIIIKEQHIGEHLKERRKELGITQKEMGKILDLSNTYISDIEVGRTVPSKATLTRLLEVLEGDITLRCNSDK